MTLPPTAVTTAVPSAPTAGGTAEEADMKSSMTEAPVSRASTRKYASLATQYTAPGLPATMAGEHGLGPSLVEGADHTRPPSETCAVWCGAMIEVYSCSCLHKM